MISSIKALAKPLVLNNRLASTIFRKHFFGLNNLDKKILEYIDYTDGYFIELGANDGITQSNTKHFELFKGWHGVLIEPSPTQFKKLKKFRSKRNYFYNAACVAFDFPKDNIELIYSNLMSVALEGRNDILDPLEHAKSGEKHSDKEQTFRFQAQARTLQSILDESNSPALVDLLSLDVEGGELEVLGGVDFQKTNFKFIVIETRSIDSVRKFLNGHGYKELAQLTHHDYIFQWVRS
jgi:FkbM family methyltransferase